MRRRCGMTLVAAVLLISFIFLGAALVAAVADGLERITQAKNEAARGISRSRGCRPGSAGTVRTAGVDHAPSSLPGRVRMSDDEAARLDPYGDLA
jgi:hypothetical protein